MGPEASMYIALGYRCNHHCFFCPCGKEKGIVAANTDSILSAIIDGVEKRNVHHITLSGGEPTLHPDFSKILGVCMSLDTDVTVLTNGDGFHNLNFAERSFEKARPDRVTVVSAIHADDAKLHDRVTGVEGSFKRTVKGLKNVMSLHFPVVVKQCVSAWNYQRLPNFADFLFREFGPGVSATVCGMDFCGMSEMEINTVAVGYKVMGTYIEGFLDSLESIRRKYNAFPRITISDLPLCCVDPYYWRYFVKSSRRTLRQYSAPGNIDESIGSSFDIRSDCDIYFKACQTCVAANLCPGVWHSAYRFFGEGEATSIRESNI